MGRGGVREARRVGRREHWPHEAGGLMCSTSAHQWGQESLEGLRWHGGLMDVSVRAADLPTRCALHCLRCFPALLTLLATTQEACL